MNLLHRDDIDPSAVKTDGKGNVEFMPLVSRKPCFGRLERFIAVGMGGSPWWKNGELTQGRTTCDTCCDKSPGTFAACSALVDERLNSSSQIRTALEKWLERCNGYGKVCFVGSQLKPWDAFLKTIEDHGGWKSVNNDQVIIEALRVENERDRRRKATRRKRRLAEKALRRGKAEPITLDYDTKLRSERERRASHLKGLRVLSGKTKRDMLWLKMLDDTGCERIAAVWEARERLMRLSQQPTGQAIAQVLFDSREWPLKFPSLRARVYEDLKRLEKLADETAGAALWPRWNYNSQTI